MKLLAWSFRIIAVLSLSALGYAKEPSPKLDKHRVDPKKLQDGDLVFIRSHSRNAKAISYVTKSDFTHCGIVFNENGTWRVREGAGMHTDYADLNAWQDKESTNYETKKIDKYEPISVRRLKEVKNWSKEQRAGNIQKLRNEARKLHETYYDFGFAWDNHYTVQNKTDHFSKNADDKEYVYCSELIYKAFARALTLKLGDLKTLGDYPLNKEAKEILNNPRGIKSRGDKEYRLDETVISPQGISDSNLLESVNVETQ
jgi:Permuted papain-like amidase enzyme, YaeF/YiiX, C92 family